MAFPSSQELTSSSRQLSAAYTSSVDTSSASSTTSTTTNTTTMPIATSTNPYLSSRNPVVLVPSEAAHSVGKLLESTLQPHGESQADKLYFTLKANRDNSELGNEATRCLTQYTTLQFFQTSDKRALFELIQHAHAIKNNQLRELCINNLKIAKLETSDYELLIEFADFAQSIEAEQDAHTLRALAAKYCPQYKDEAKKALKNVLERKPKCVYAYRTLGMILLSEKSYVEAENALLSAIMVNPRPAPDYVVLASILKHQNRLDDALEAVQKSIQLNPNIDLAYEMQATIFYHQHRLDDATAALLQALDLNPNNAEAHNLYNKICGIEDSDPALGKEAQRCLQSYKNEQKFYTDDKRALFELYRHATQTKNQQLLLFCAFHLEEKKFDSSDYEVLIEFADFARSIRANQSAIDLQKKALLCRPKDSEEAKQALKRIIQRNSQCAYAHRALGVILHEEKSYYAAEKELQTAIWLDPQSAGSYLVLANVLMQLDRLDEALEAVQNSILLDPHSNLAYETKDTILFLRERFVEMNEAERTLREAIEENPTDPLSYEALGDMLKEGGRLDEARGLFSKAIDLNPTNCGLYIKFAETLYEEKLYDLAKTTLQQIIRGYMKMGLKDGDEYMQKATELLSKVMKSTRVVELSEMDETVQGFREAIQESPNDLFVYETLSDVLKEQGRLEEAADALLEIIVFDPTNLEIHEKYEAIAQSIKDQVGKRVDLM